MCVTATVATNRTFNQLSCLSEHKIAQTVTKRWTMIAAHAWKPDNNLSIPRYTCWRLALLSPDLALLRAIVSKEAA